MFELLLYFAIITIIGVAFHQLIVAKMLLCRVRDKRNRVLTSALFFILLLLIEFAPYFWLESRTLVWSARLKPATIVALNTIGHSTEIYSLKVLTVNQSSARVFVITLCEDANNREDTQYMALIIRLKLENNEWVYHKEDNAVWSDCGSADGNVFPPYPDSHSPKWLRTLAW